MASYQGFCGARICQTSKPLDERLTTQPEERVNDTWTNITPLSKHRLLHSRCTRVLADKRSNDQKICYGLYFPLITRTGSCVAGYLLASTRRETVFLTHCRPLSTVTLTVPHCNLPSPRCYKEWKISPENKHPYG